MGLGLGHSVRISYLLSVLPGLLKIESFIVRTILLAQNISSAIYFQKCNNNFSFVKRALPLANLSFRKINSTLVVNTRLTSSF